MKFTVVRSGDVVLLHVSENRWKKCLYAVAWTTCWALVTARCFRNSGSSYYAFLGTILGVLLVLAGILTINESFTHTKVWFSSSEIRVRFRSLAWQTITVMPRGDVRHFDNSAVGHGRQPILKLVTTNGWTKVMPRATDEELREIRNALEDNDVVLPR